MKTFTIALLATLTFFTTQTQAFRGNEMWAWDPSIQRYIMHEECIAAAENEHRKVLHCDLLTYNVTVAEYTSITSTAANGNRCRAPFYEECIKNRCDSRKSYYQECLSASGIQHFDVESCEADFRSKKELQILRGKFDLSISADPPFEILANKKFPTAKEKKLISLWVSEHQRCMQLAKESDKVKFSPESSALRDKADTDMLFAAADLYAGKISYGEFAKAQIKIHQELEANEADLRQQLISKLKKRMQDTEEEQRRQQEQAYQTERQNQLLRAQEEQARRNAALQILLNRPPPPPVVYTPIVPYQFPHRTTTNTNCTPDGYGGFNCTTR